MSGKWIRFYGGPWGGKYADDVLSDRLPPIVRVPVRPTLRITKVSDEKPVRLKVDTADYRMRRLTSGSQGGFGYVLEELARQFHPEYPIDLDLLNELMSKEMG